jgi:excisionase family DNA binding protein
MSAFWSSTFWTKKQLKVGSLKTVPDVDCETTSASNPEGKVMAGPNKEPIAGKVLDLKAGGSGAKLTVMEVATRLKVHLTTVYKMAKRRELPGFKIASDWRFDSAQVEGWMRSRMQGPEG